jgi:hypothetical protein
MSSSTGIKPEITVGTGVVFEAEEIVKIRVLLELLLCCEVALHKRRSNLDEDYKLHNITFAIKNIRSFHWY